MAMASDRDETRNETRLSASFTTNGVITEGWADVAGLVDRLKSALSRKLDRPGIEVVWREAASAGDLRIQFVRIDKGNQLVRHLVPFLAPASVEIKGSYQIPKNGSIPFHHVEKTSFGLFGGSARHMLGVCVDRLALQLAHDVSRAIRA